MLNANSKDGKEYGKDEIDCNRLCTICLVDAILNILVESNVVLHAVAERRVTRWHKTNSWILEQQIRLVGEDVVHFKIGLILQIFVERKQHINNGVCLIGVPLCDNFPIDNCRQKATGIDIEARICGKRAIATKNTEVVGIQI